MTYQIRCRVWGGRTGTRESLLQENGIPVACDTREEAQRIADALNEKMNSRFASANYRYSVEPTDAF